MVTEGAFETHLCTGFELRPHNLLPLLKGRGGLSPAEREGERMGEGLEVVDILDAVVAADNGTDFNSTLLLTNLVTPIHPHCSFPLTILVFCVGGCLR